MRVVWLLPYLPLPVTTGGRRRVSNLLKRLSCKHEISLVAYHRGESDEIVQTVRDMVERLYLIKRRPTRSARNFLLWAAGPWPFMAVANGFCGSMVDALREAVAESKPDIIQCEHFHMWQILSSARKEEWPPVLLAEQGVEFLVTQRFLKAKHSVFNRIGLWIELVKARTWEKKVFLAADGVAVVSHGDKELISEYAPSVETWVVDNGVDLDEFTPPKDEGRRERNTLLFVGTFSFFGNRDALRYICTEILPEVRRRRPGTILKVIGERPPQIEADGVELLGAVDRVVPFLRQASLLLAPLRTGSGTKLKIIEAMACGLPFVTTDLGMEGLEGASGAGIVASRTDELIEACLRVLEDKSVASRLGEKGRRVAEADYSWDKSAAALETAWKEIASSK